MGRRKRGITDFFNDSAFLNDRTYQQYLWRLTELAISSFEWTGLPDTVDPRYLELQLFETGSAVYFRDEVVGDLCLNCIPSGQFDVYGNPITRRAYSAYNNYNKELTESDSVIVWNNNLRTNSTLDIQMFARRLYLYDRVIDVNVNAQKTPVLLQGSDKQQLTLRNLYMQYDGNAPFIFGDKSLDMNGLKVLNTGAPYVSDKIYELKSQVWNEALTYLGISNIQLQKKARLVTDEVMRNQGGTMACRFSRLSARKIAAEKINRMFGTNISVQFRDAMVNDPLEGGEELE